MTNNVERELEKHLQSYLQNFCQAIIQWFQKGLRHKLFNLFERNVDELNICAALIIFYQICLAAHHVEELS